MAKLGPSWAKLGSSCELEPSLHPLEAFQDVLMSSCRLLLVLKSSWSRFEPTSPRKWHPPQPLGPEIRRRGGGLEDHKPPPVEYTQGHLRSFLRLFPSWADLGCCARAAHEGRSERIDRFAFDCRLEAIWMRLRVVLRASEASIWRSWGPPGAVLEPS